LGGRHVAADEDLRRRLAITEYVVGGAEPRLEVLETEWTVALGEHLGRRDEDIGPDLLVSEIVSEMLEP